MPKFKGKYLGGHNLALVVSAVLLMFGVSTATWDVHTHTGNGTIDTTPTNTAGDHKLQAQAPPEGTIWSMAYENWPTPIKDITARDGACTRSGAFNLTTPVSWPYHHYSATAHHLYGTAKSWLASENEWGNLPTCSSN